MRSVAGFTPVWGIFIGYYSRHVSCIRVTHSFVASPQALTGLDVEPVRIVGVYSDPRHVFAYADGEVRQEFSICLACRIVGGQLTASEESSQVAFFAPEEIERLDMHPSIRMRIRDYLDQQAPALR